ncbi:phage tail tip lysozyme [Burkholderia dolosa]|uniref:phage tail tip lysozyme n=1 Tax=Burkholderia dolosa TaxID=152500 RepID=UPI0015924C98|nr:phage tail tip lysozyme [Burkholderia dolosa]
MATIVDALVVTLGFDLSAFKRGKAEAGAATKKLSAVELAAAKEIEARNKKAAESFRSIRREVLALVAIFTAGVGIKQFTESTINSAVNLGYMARNLQMSTRDLAAWQRAAERAGGSAEGITAALSASQNDISKLKFGQVTEGVQWFLRMGGSVKDLKDGNSYLLARARIISSMFKVDPGRARFIAQQMGIGDGEFNFLKQGEAAVLALVDAQRKNSAVTEQQSAQALKLRNAWLDVRDRLQYVGTTVLLELMPVFEKLLGKLQNMADWVADHKADISAWIDRAVTSIEQFVEWADKAAESVGGWKNVLAAFVALKVLSLVAPLLQLGAALGGIGSSLGIIGTLGPAALAVLAGLGIAKAIGVPDVNDASGIADIRKGDWLAASAHLSAGDFLRALAAKAAGKTNEEIAAALANPIVDKSGPVDTPGAKVGDRGMYIIQKARQRGYSDAAAAGIVGSLLQENSTLDPKIVNKIGATGIAQWLDPSRKAMFEKIYGHSLRDATFTEQVDFMFRELETTEKSAGDKLRAAKTAAQAAEIHGRDYERPGAAEANIARRQQYAQTILAGMHRANAAQIAQQTAAAAAPAAGNTTTTSSSTTETNINGPITVHTQATDAAGIVRDLGGALRRYSFVVPQANTGLS